MTKIQGLRIGGLALLGKFEDEKGTNLRQGLGIRKIREDGKGSRIRPTGKTLGSKFEDKGTKTWTGRMGRERGQDFLAKTATRNRRTGIRREVENG